MRQPDLPDDLDERTFCIAKRVEISAQADDRFHVQGRLVLEARPRTGEGFQVVARLPVREGSACALVCSSSTIRQLAAV